MPEDYEKLDRKSPPTVSLDRRTGISEVESGYDETTARLQAERCLSCHIQTVYDPQKCILCNRCVDVCPESCLSLCRSPSSTYPLNKRKLPPMSVVSPKSNPFRRC